jgi:hypothetical protein
VASILANGLRYLGTAFSLKGNVVSTDQVDLSGVSLVLDVESVLASGRGLGAQAGWGLARTIHNHVGAGSLTSTINPYFDSPAQFANGWVPIPEDFDLWIYDATIVRHTGNVGTDSDFEAEVQWPASYLALVGAGGFAGSTRRWLVSGQAVSQSAAVAIVSRPIINRVTPEFPTLLPRGGTLVVTTGAGAAGTSFPMLLEASFVMRAVPRGLRP